MNCAITLTFNYPSAAEMPDDRSVPEPVVCQNPYADIIQTWLDKGNTPSIEMVCDEYHKRCFVHHLQPQLEKWGFVVDTSETNKISVSKPE